MSRRVTMIMNYKIKLMSSSMDINYLNNYSMVIITINYTLYLYKNMA